MSRRDKQQRLSDYLSHILQAIERIGRYTSGMSEAEFLRDDMAQMRNSVAHGYFTVDFEAVWKTIQNDLAGLQARVRECLPIGDEHA